jgi:hypothetical protein
VQEVARVALRHRVALTVVGTVVLILAALLPIAVASAAFHLVGQPYSQVYSLTAPIGPPAASHTRLHAEIVALDPWSQQLTLRVSGHHACPLGCDWQDQVVFFSLHVDAPAEALDALGLPPSASVTLPASTVQVTQTITLPVSGNPTRYPFDAYDLRLGVALQHVRSDGTVQVLTPAEADGHLFLTIRDRLPLLLLGGPVGLDPRSVRVEQPAYEYLSVSQLTLHRPLWLPVLTIILVLLIAAAAGYAVFMQRMHDLVIGAGGLVLGVWGVRTILVPGGITYTTAVELSLAVVLLFLLGGISVRVLLIVWERNQLPRPRGSRAHSTVPEREPRANPNGSMASDLPRIGRGERRRKR